MLAHCRAVAPRARFLVGQAERLPFPAGSLDLYGRRLGMPPVVSLAGSFHF